MKADHEINNRRTVISGRYFEKTSTFALFQLTGIAREVFANQIAVAGCPSASPNNGGNNRYEEIRNITAPVKAMFPHPAKKVNNFGQNHAPGSLQIRLMAR
jgi:hypothetical protein